MIAVRFSLSALHWLLELQIISVRSRHVTVAAVPLPLSYTAAVRMILSAPVLRVSNSQPLNICGSWSLHWTVLVWEQPPDSHMTPRQLNYPLIHLCCTKLQFKPTNTYSWCTFNEQHRLPCCSTLDDPSWRSEPTSGLKRTTENIHWLAMASVQYPWKHRKSLVSCINSFEKDLKFEDAYLDQHTHSRK